jgi:predicted alpha/beta superfamily hydrolase
MFSQPELFSGYILGSPSLWYDNHVMAKAEAGYAAAHKDLPARAYMFVGEYEDMRPGDPRYATRYNMVSDARTLDKTLKARRYPSLDLSLEVLNDEDHLSVAPRGFTHGLKHLLPAEPS